MDNLRGAALMTLSMAMFAVEDALIKSLTGTIPPGQIVAILGAGGVAAFSVWFLLNGQGLWTPAYTNGRVLLRTGFEAFGTMFFVSALALIPLTTASAVIQATPLVVAMGAAVFLGQPVGWRRWLAILIGFLGVLVIIRPGMAGFAPATLLAVFGMLGLACRDLTTRALTVRITGAQVSWLAFLALVPAGLALCTIQGQALVWPTAKEAFILAIGVSIGIAAYLSIVAATRAGDAAITSSFRYSRMVFALIVGFIAFGERPDAYTLVGAAIVIAAGLFTLIREARLARASHVPKPAL